MPGGDDFRRWYAMRQRLRQAGKWHGKDKPTHSVPQQEEGEPAAKEPKLKDPRSTGATWGGKTPSPESPFPGNKDVLRVQSKEPETPESLPPLESPPTAEGKWHTLRRDLVSLHGLNLQQDYYPVSMTNLQLSVYVDNCLLISILFWGAGGIWNFQSLQLTINCTPTVLIIVSQYPTELLEQPSEG